MKNNMMNNFEYLVKLLTQSLFFLFFFNLSNAYAGYADGTGTGKLQNQIYWLDWQGFTFANGHSKTFNLPGGVVVTATVSGVSGGTISVGRPEDYSPAAMNRTYPNTGHTAIKSCNACTNRFTMSFTASVGGLSIPVDLVAADAEAAASTEYMKMTTNGDSWRLLEQLDAHNLRATWTNADKTLELHGNGATTYGTVLAVSTGVTSFVFEIKGGGISAAALGVFLPFDYGDAPSSLGEAGNYIRQTYTGGEPGSQKVYDPVISTFHNFANISNSPDLYLGSVKPDADPGTQNSQVNAVGDNNDGNNDEEGVSSFPQLVAGNYTVNVTAYNTGSAANLYGWIDFNSDGIFQSTEAAVSTVSSTGTTALTWNSINPTLLPGTPVYARFRLTRTNLTDNSGTSKDERAEGGAGDGEVEDYAILPPVASPDTYSVAEDGSLIVAASPRGVLANDHDPASKPLTAIPVSGVSSGSLSLNADGSFTYTPNTLFSGTDSFTYKANDGSRDSNVATATITVNHVNHVPLATPDAYTTPEDVPLVVMTARSVLNNDADVDALDHLSALIVSNAASGAVVLNADGTFSYAPNANFNGADSFTYKANDGHADSNIVTVDIIVTAVNDAPVAQADLYHIAEDTTLNSTQSVLQNDSDPEGNVITAVKVVSPAHGSLQLNADGRFKYIPDPNFNGDDSFTYHATDGHLSSPNVKVTIRVTPVNDPPVGLADAYSVHEDTGLSVNVARGLLKNDTDPENNPLTVNPASNVTHGALHLNKDGSFDYTPALNYNGLDSFTYQVNDGQLDSNIITVTLSIDAVNDAPVAVTDAYTTLEETLLTIIVKKGLIANDTDPDGDHLLALLEVSPVHGKLQFNLDGSFTYLPELNYTGADSFTYKLNDGNLDSNIATVNLTVRNVNDAPLAANDIYYTQEDRTLTVSPGKGVLDNDLDFDGDHLKARLVTPPANGVVQLNKDGSFQYSPNLNFNGNDSFTYQAFDGSEYSGTVTATIVVTAVNDAPVAVDDLYSIGENGFLKVALSSGLLANDFDIDQNILHVNGIVTSVTNGVLQMHLDGSFTYKPNFGFFGSDSFTYKVNDGKVDSIVATVTITVNHVNTPPLPNGDAYTIAQDRVLQVSVANGLLANDLDINGDTLLVANIPTSVSHGTLQMKLDGSFSYTPKPGYSGPDSFTYTVNDGTVDVGPVTVNLTVTHTNHVPLAGDDAYNLAQDGVLTIPANGLLANDLDIDGDKLFVLIQTYPVNGALHQNLDGGFTYQPAPGFQGVDRYTYMASDSQLNSQIVTVTLNVNHSNHAPLAGDDSYSTARDTVIQISSALGVLVNDIDLDADTLSAVIMSQPVNGAVQLNQDGSFKYTPAAAYAGLDSFSYKARDSLLESNIATVVIDVHFTNRAPVATVDSYSIAQDTLLQVNIANGLLANDTDPDGNALQSIIVTQPQHGILHMLGDGSFNYQPSAGYAGLDSFTYKANDAHADSNTVTVSIRVNAINHAPVTQAGSYSTPQNITLQVPAPGVLKNASDPDGDQLTAILVSGPATGSLHLNVDGSFTYTPAQVTTKRQLATQVSFTFIATDGQLTSANTVIQINIIPDTVPAPAKLIPTLSQWAMMLLSLLMMLVAGRFRYRVK